MTTTSTTLVTDQERLARNQTLAYFASFLTLGLVAAALGPTLPGLAGNTGSTIGEISVLFTALALGQLIGAMGSGRWYDRMPAHPIVAGAILIIAVMLALTPLVSSLIVLVAMLFAIGFSMGSIDVGGNTLLVWVHRQAVEPKMQALHFFFGFGAFISPIIVVQALRLDQSITWAYWALALLVLPPALLLLRLPSPIAPATTETGDRTHARTLLVILLATLFFLYVGAELSFGGWIYSYAITLELATLTTAGYLTSMFWGSLTLGRLLSIPIASRVRPRYMLIADTVGLLLSMTILVLWRDVPGVVWVASFGMGLSMANVFPTLMNLAESHMPITGNITSWFLVGASLGSMTVPWLIGQGFEAIGPQVTMVIILSTIVLSVIVLGAFLLAVSRQSTTQ